MPLSQGSFLSIGTMSKTYGGFLDVSRMGKIDTPEEVEEALQRVVFPLAMILVFPTEKNFPKNV